MSRDEILTTTQAAERSGYRQITIRKACIAGTLKAKKFGRDWHITARDLDVWIRDEYIHKHGPKS